MGSEAHRIPAIDFTTTNIKQAAGSPEWESVKAKVQKAIEEYGCFQAFYNLVPSELKGGIVAALEELFNLPRETKMRTVCDKPRHGYAGNMAAVPLFESLGFEDADNLENLEKLTDVLWPQGNPNFSNTIQSFSYQLGELDKIVRRMIVEILGLEKYMDEHMDSTYYLLRVNKYEAPLCTEKKIGLIPHVDTHVVSVLYQNHVDGLEYQTKDGEWITINTSPDSFTVIMGEALNAWTNGRLKIPYHRVMMTGNEARYSTVLFSIFKGGYVVNAPEEMVNEEHPRQFRPFESFEFQNFRQTNPGRESMSPLKAFCGIE